MTRIYPSGQLPGPGWAPSWESPTAPGLETLTGREAPVVPLTPHPLSLYTPLYHLFFPTGPQILISCFIQKVGVGTPNATISWQYQALEPWSLISFLCSLYHTHT
jgi:hypothetical protein